MKPSAIKKDLIDKTEAAAGYAQEDANTIFKYFINKFYGEYEPKAYVRKNQLHNALQKSEIRSIGNGHEGDVYLDAGRMYHPKGLVPLKWQNSKSRYGRKGYGWASWGEGTILEHAAIGAKPHGNYAKGTTIYTAPVSALDRMSRDILRKACIKAGIPI